MHGCYEMICSDMYVKLSISFIYRFAGRMIVKAFRREAFGTDCCQWCSDVAGKYEMKDQPQGIFRRHDNCDYTIIYDGQVLRGQVGDNGRHSKKWVEVPKDAGAAEPVRLHKEQAKIKEQNKINNFAENSKIKSDSPRTIVNPAIINSPEYRKKFILFNELPQVERKMYIESKKMLRHRSETKFEDLSFIDSKTGKHLTRDDYDVEKEVIPTKRMISMVESSEPYSIIAIHNHPESGAPSIVDIDTAAKKNYKYGIAVCHNGNMFRYKVLKNFDLSDDNLDYVNMLLDKVEKIVYNKNELGDKYFYKLNNTLNDLKERKVILEVILWE